METTTMEPKVTEAQLAAMFRETVGVASAPRGWTAVGAWVRVSSGGQDEANQVPQIIRYCVERRYWVTRWYVVHGKSAYHGRHQNDLNEALADMRAGETFALVIWHSDRIERRPGKALLDVLVEFNDAGGRVESVQEPTLGQLDFGGQVTTFISGLVNHEKSKHIADQVNLAFDRIRANNGTSNRVPWGYETTGPKYNRQMVPNDICRKYVPLIYQRCIAGDSCRTIAAWLDSEGVPTDKGGHWNEGTVRWLIKNRTYAGRRTRRDDSETYQRCEAVVTMDVWEQANQALRDRPKRGPVAKDNRPLFAKLRCARCGSAMYRIKAGRGDYARNYYRCFGNGPQRKGCGNMVLYDRLENMVIIRMLAWNDEPHQTKEWVKGKTWDAEIADISQDIRELAQNPLAPDFLERMAEKQAELADYTERNKNRERGHWKFIDVLNDDGTLKTKGQYFYDLYTPYIEGRGSIDPARDYLKSHDIRAEKMLCCGGIRVTINGREDVAHKTGCTMAA